MLTFRDHAIWHERHSGGGRTPILVLHGGPGAAHDYLEPLGKLASSGRDVIFYDQIGCGKSQAIADPALLEPALFVAEIDAIRAQLELDDVFIIGQSWGGMLAMEYALTQPRGVRGMVVADSPSDMKLWVSEANRLRGELPKDVQATLTEHEAAGTTDDPAYEAAVDEFYKRHVCRIWPFPSCVQRTFESIKANPTVYHTMNGPSEFHVIGTLKDWDITSRLGEITIPTLVISGRYDEATPEIAGRVHRGIPNSDWIVFEESSHMPHIEEATAFNAAVLRFFDRMDAEARS